MKKSRAAVILSIISVVFLALTVVGTILLQVYFDQEAVRNFVKEHAVLGTLLMLAICMAQVIVALVPGEVVEVASGIVFGPIGGLLVCLVGSTLGSVVVLFLVRRFGRKFVYVFYPQEKLDALALFKDTPQRSLLTFLLFLIPGTPKDLLTYCIGLTNMSIPKYLVLTTFARIPSIITSTFGGDMFLKENYLQALILFGSTALVSGLGLVLYHLIKRKYQAAHKPAEASAKIPTVEASDDTP